MTAPDATVFDEPQFGAPPAIAYTPAMTKHRRIANALRERPGEWAQIAERATRESAQQLAKGIRAAVLPSYAPPGSFQAVSRDTGVWAMFGCATDDPE